MKAHSKSVLTLTALALALSACGSNAAKDSGSSPSASAGASASPSPSATKAASQEKTKLAYWTAERGRADFLKDTVKRYNETNKDNIEVEITIFADNYAQAVDAAYAGGTAPDIINVSGVGTLGTLVAKNYLEPLDSYLTPELKKQNESLLKEGVNTLQGKIYSLPNQGSTYRLLYNVDLLNKAGYAKPPETLDELVDAAKKITQVGKPDGVYGFALPYKSPASALSRSAAVIASLTGYEKSGFDFKTGKYDFSGYAEIIQAFRQMWVDGSTFPGSESTDIDPLKAQFAEGKIGFLLSSSNEPGVFKTQFPAKIKWAAATVPTAKGVRGGAAYMTGGTWYGIGKQSKNKDKAWKFLSYMYGDQVLTESQEVAGWLSMVPAIVAKAKLPDIPGTEYFLPGKYDAIWPQPPENIVPEGKNSDQAFVDYIIAGGNLDKIIQGLNDSYNAALSRSGQKVTPNPSFNPSQLQQK
ncbi:MAG: extracellular solute-binding protein [Paenibacillaceae bacterium]|nr:extracellular solute-binding protein [Paenibacillaceae bacterium]